MQTMNFVIIWFLIGFVVTCVFSFFVKVFLKPQNRHESFSILIPLIVLGLVLLGILLWPMLIVYMIFCMYTWMCTNSGQYDIQITIPPALGGTAVKKKVIRKPVTFPRAVADLHPRVIAKHGTSIDCAICCDPMVLKHKEPPVKQYPWTGMTTCLVRLDHQDTCATSCDHVFHFKCLARWLRSKSTCPTCRENQEMYQCVVVYGSGAVNRQAAADGSVVVQMDTDGSACDKPIGKGVDDSRCDDVDNSHNESSTSTDGVYVDASNSSSTSASDKPQSRSSEVEQILRAERLDSGVASGDYPLFSGQIIPFIVTRRYSLQWTRTTSVAGLANRAYQNHRLHTSTSAIPGSGEHAQGHGPDSDRSSASMDTIPYVPSHYLTTSQPSVKTHDAAKSPATTSHVATVHDGPTVSMPAVTALPNDIAFRRLYTHGRRPRCNTYPTAAADEQPDVDCRRAPVY